MVKTSGHWSPSHLCVQDAAAVTTASACCVSEGGWQVLTLCASVSAAFRQNSKWLSILTHMEAKTKDQGRIRDD